MNLRIQLFATLKERANTSSITLTLPETATVSDLLTALAAHTPALAAALPTTLVAVNREYAFPEQPLTPHDEIALFPPVSGG